MSRKTSTTVGREPTDDIWKAMYTQRAIRYWQDKPVPRDLLKQVIEAASKAPSGSNTQPWVFVVVDDAAKREAIAAALRGFFEGAESLKQVLSQAEQSPNKTERLMLRGARAFFTQLERAPVLIIPCLYQLSSPTGDPTSLLAGSSIYGAIQNLQLAARALGLGTVLTTAHGMIEADLRKVIAVPADAYPVAMIPLGFPDANFGPTTRKGVDEILKWNAWS